MSAGFGFGAFLFGSLLFSGSPGNGWLAVTQAHGHAQIVGWAGLMVLGVGLHFLPRLASVTPPRGDLTRLAFWIIFLGLVLRTICQPAAAVVDTGWLRAALEMGWILGAIGELMGTLVLGGALATSLRASTQLRAGGAIRAILPYLATAFGSLLLALTWSLAATLDAVRRASAYLDGQDSHYPSLIGMYGFLVIISVVMSIRVFPLYLRTRSARMPFGYAGLALLIVGLVLRLVTTGDQASIVGTGGRSAILLAVISFAIAVRVFEPRRPLSRRRLRIWEDAPGLHGLSAYVWLFLAAAAQSGGERWLGLELHLLGTGFVTMLILGVGIHLLPGFARQSMRGSGYVWATLALGNLATICRAVPAIPDLHLPATADQYLGATAGLAGISALCLFAFNLSGALWTAGHGNSTSSPSA